MKGNPVIYRRPFEDWTSLTGFRDPYAFQSARISELLSNSTSQTGANGDLFVTVSGGVPQPGNAGSIGGGRLFLYRQTQNDDFTDWTFLGPLFGAALSSSYSPWSGSEPFSLVQNLFADELTRFWKQLRMRFGRTFE